MKTNKTDIKPVNLANFNLLIADDNELGVEIMKYLLADTGAVVMLAGSGSEALNIINGSSIDLVFLDLKLPDMNSYQIVEHIRKHHPGLPVIAQTAFIFEKDKQKIMDAGFNDVILKPFSREDILTILHKFLLQVKGKIEPGKRNQGRTSYPPDKDLFLHVNLASGFM